MRVQSIIFLGILSILFGLGSGCNGFLDVQSDDELSRNDLFATLRGAEAAVVGLYFGLGDAAYYRFRMPVYADLPGNTIPPASGGGIRDDFGGFGLGLVDLHARTLDPTLEFTGMAGLYDHAYELLFQASDIIDAIPELTEGDEAREASLVAEARVIRALIHFDLVRLFARNPQFPFGTSDLGIVVIDDVPGIFDASPRASLAVTYSAIINDLELALDNLDPDFSRRGGEAIWITPAVVHGLLARVHAYRGDWPACAAAADACLNATDRTLTLAGNYVDSWRNGRLEETLWALDVQRFTLDGDEQVLFSPARIVGVGDEEAFLRVNPALIDRFPPGDLRRNLYETDDDGEWRTSKWTFDTNRVDNPVLLRLSDVHLLRAEARLELDDPEGALEDLALIYDRANPGGPPLPTEVTALRAAIRAERRRELAFEGHHFFDLARWGEDLDREVCRDFVTPCLLPVSDPRFVLPIPLESILRNPNLRQNAGY